MEIHFSPEMIARLDDAAKSIGCGTDEFVQKIVSSYVADIKIDSGDSGRDHRAAAAQTILDLQKHVLPDPEGWTIHDYK